MVKKTKKSEGNRLMELLEDIRRLLIFSLYKKSKISTKEIGSILGVSYKTIERIVSGKNKS